LPRTKFDPDMSAPYGFWMQKIRKGTFSLRKWERLNNFAQFVLKLEKRVLKAAKKKPRILNRYRNLLRTCIKNPYLEKYKDKFIATRKRVTPIKKEKK
jgi:hypothetical protein